MKKLAFKLSFERILSLEHLTTASVMIISAKHKDTSRGFHEKPGKRARQPLTARLPSSISRTNRHNRDVPEN